MNHRQFGRIGRFSEIGFGAWAIGADWGDVSEADAVGALNAALDAGVDFIDTADVYGDGRSERLIARVLKERGAKGKVFVATKAGRRARPHVADAYNAANLAAWIERSLRNLETDSLDLVQLHCPPTEVYYRPEVFGALDDLKKAGKIRHYGVSVEKVEEAIKATEYPGVESAQIIFNIFRQRPAELFFRLARERQVGVIVRVPLASGLLSGRMTRDTAFGADDHRAYNRQGAAFDVGETFSGVPYETGLDAVEDIRALVPEGQSMAGFALKWILMEDAVGTVIPGARNAEQARANAAASGLPALSEETMRRLQKLYDARIRAHVHHRW